MKPGGGVRKGKAAIASQSVLARVGTER